VVAGGNGFPVFGGNVNKILKENELIDSVGVPALLDENASLHFLTTPEYLRPISGQVLKG